MRYLNPIIRGFNPDPSICRVGNDFYLVTSSFEFFPGIPVYHSTDLVNWTLLGNCINRPDQLNFTDASVGRGIWAPTIRHDRGMFYVTACFMEYGNFIIHSGDPAGPWSDPVRVNIGGIDPSLLFDDGKAYYCTNQQGSDGKETIVLAQVDPMTGALLSDIRPIWHGDSVDRPQYLEAPHIYHVGDWFYLLCAEGGTRFHHMITAARSRCIWGPYENCPGNPLLTNRYVTDTGVAGSGHGDLVEDAQGNWWCIHLATRPNGPWYSHLGRETFLLPMTWKDDWPVIADGVSHLDCDGPLAAMQQPLQPWTADLSRLEPQWLFLRCPVKEHYAFGPQGLTLTPSLARLTDQRGSPTMIAVRHMDVDCTIEAEIDFAPLQEGDEAGITMFISCDGHYTLSKRRERGQDCIVVAKNSPDFEPIRAAVPQGTAVFRLEAARSTYTLTCNVDGEVRLKEVIPVLTESDAGKGFTGTLIGVFAQCTQPTEARAVLKKFTMSC